MAKRKDGKVRHCDLCNELMLPQSAKEKRAAKRAIGHGQMVQFVRVAERAYAEARAHFEDVRALVPNATELLHAAVKDTRYCYEAVSGFATNMCGRKTCTDCYGLLARAATAKDEATRLWSLYYEGEEAHA